MTIENIELEIRSFVGNAIDRAKYRLRNDALSYSEEMWLLQHLKDGVDLLRKITESSSVPSGGQGGEG